MSTMVATEPEVMPKAEVTPEELLAMPDGGHYELIDGELRERNSERFIEPGCSRESIGFWAIIVDDHQLGWILAAELGYRCFPWKPGRVRRADVSFIRANRRDQGTVVRGILTIPRTWPSRWSLPTISCRELDEKVEEYLRAGVKLVWVVRPQVRTVQVFRGDGSESWLRAVDELSGEDVLPGFRCQVDDLVSELPDRRASHTARPGPAAPSPSS